MTVLYEGTLKQNNESFHVTLLSLEHIEQILSLQNIVVEALEDKSRLQPLSQEEFQYILEGNGMMIGALSKTNSSHFALYSSLLSTMNI